MFSEFREAFRLFDKDGDGSITKDELGRVMRSLGQFARSEELQEMLQEIDSDGEQPLLFPYSVTLLRLLKFFSHYFWCNGLITSCWKVET